MQRGKTLKKTSAIQAPVEFYLKESGFNYSLVRNQLQVLLNHFIKAAYPPTTTHLHIQQSNKTCKNKEWQQQVGFHKLERRGFSPVYMISPLLSSIFPLFCFSTPLLLPHLPLCMASEDGGEGSKMYSRNVRHGVLSVGFV